MQTRFLIVALSVTVFGTQSGTAQETIEDKFYADIGYTRSGSDITQFTESYHAPEYGSIGGNIGYQFSEHWGIEGEATFGVESDKLNFTSASHLETARVRTKSELEYIVGVYLKGHLPVTSKLNASARFGMATGEVEHATNAFITDMETEETSETSTQFTQQDTGFALGVGLTYDVTDKVYLRTDYTRYDLENFELDGLQLGVGVRF